MTAVVMPAQVPSEVPQYRVTVSVADNRGNPVTGLTAADFVVTYQVTFPAAESTNLPMRVTVKGRSGLTVIAPSWALR